MPITPAAPTAVTATPGDTQASVSWTAPSWNGGSAVTSSTIVATPSDGSLPTVTKTGCGSSPCPVTGLTNGAGYTFTVTALNAAGSGPTSTATSAATIPYPAVLTASGSVLWLDAADPATVFQDAAMTTPTTTAGESISAWKDKSGQANHVTAPGSAPTPTPARSRVRPRPCSAAGGT